jgi:hypothetical protein
MQHRITRRRAAAAAALLIAGVISTGATASASHGSTTVVKYRSTSAADYATKWANIYGPGELAAGGTLNVAKSGAITVDAHQFHTGYDFSVFDHLKYIGVSTSSFAVPTSGSLEFGVDIKASTPGTQRGRVVHGCYGAPGSYLAVGDPCAQPWSGVALEGQQAGVVLNMISFDTGQLFDWFVSGNRVFALIERLPSNVTGTGNVGLDKAYTQIIKERPIEAGETVHVSIRYSRSPGRSSVDYFLDDDLFAHVDHVGIPLDQQGKPFTGTYPSLGSGEELSPSSFVIGHGLFSLLDAFPFQHPDRPDLSVSIPVSERIFGQGAVGTFSNFTVTTRGS